MPLVDDDRKSVGGLSCLHWPLPPSSHGLTRPLMPGACILILADGWSNKIQTLGKHLLVSLSSQLKDGRRRPLQEARGSLWPTCHGCYKQPMHASEALAPSGTPVADGRCLAASSVVVGPGAAAGMTEWQKRASTIQPYSHKASQPGEPGGAKARLVGVSPFAPHARSCFRPPPRLRMVPLLALVGGGLLREPPPPLSVGICKGLAPLSQLGCVP
jgi:hypothetical protein